MSFLQLAAKARAIPVANPAARLYRSICKEVPRVLTIYDIDLPISTARKSIREHFDKNDLVQDQRVREMLIERGYMELEETLLQHKQRSHLSRVFTSYIEESGANRKRLGRNATMDEQFARN
eukprot:CAMPEP_0113537514 /NCGR_PEP_ID=MMETSP0015_2-20120614/6867_1 /TAXON_ID=2838 /ORGANISM="Odontella" /LENGTH=121 /DNA_ID=CAMNT_0000437015 /DNA_START=25 /DNA_END=390 /DNA_ORIENTATION=- /assembly_acc=CAM_ASM_000160